MRNDELWQLLQVSKADDTCYNLGNPTGNLTAVGTLWDAYSTRYAFISRETFPVQLFFPMQSLPNALLPHFQPRSEEGFR
jgi:hypothetical protein